MQIRKFTDIRLIKSEWKELYEKNPIFTPFQSYEWNLLQQVKFRHPINWLTGIVLSGYARIEYWIFSENENYVIAPLIIYTTKTKIHIFGQQEDLTDYLSNRNERMSYFEFCIIPKFTTPSLTALRLYVSLFKNFAIILSPLCGFQKGLRCVAPIV